MAVLLFSYPKQTYEFSYMIFKHIKTLGYYIYYSEIPKSGEC